MIFSRKLSLLFLFFTLVLSILLVMGLLFAGRGTSADVNGREVAMKHSSLLSMVECDGYTVVDVANPWGSGLLKRYILVAGDAEIPSSLPDGVLLRTPVDRMLLFSGVHAALFEELGVAANIKAVCDAEYIYSTLTVAAISEGKVIDCGSSLDVDLERVAEASPDAVFVLPYENGGYGKLERVDAPLVECADYMESSPLACAEWMRFYGRLVGKAAEADSLFNAICNEYEALCFLAERSSSRPKLLCELKSGSAWYVPAGESTMGRMYSHAGADYIFSSSKGRGSIPLSFETVLERAADADIWLMKYNSPVDKAYSSLLAEYSGYSHFRPYQERNIYACNTRTKRIFEDSSFHPEKLLKELIALLHPALFPDYALKYYERMR